jgi:hypothetical protein
MHQSHENGLELGRSMWFVVLVGLAAALFSRSHSLGLWRLRLAVGRLLSRLPERAPTHLRVLPPPQDEYVGTIPASPTTVRRRHLPRAGFDELVRAYFHAYERDGETVHEVGSFVRRPDGLLGDGQLHVRLFPTPDGTTEVWAHWERNPYVAPLAHLRMDGYDPAEGERRVRRLLAALD